MGQQQQELPSIEQIYAVLGQTLSTDLNTRKAAEKQLADALTTPGYPLQVLSLVASEKNIDKNVRLSAAVYFKNIVKKGWDVLDDDGNTALKIEDSERDLIKNNLVELMCKAPPQIKVQCSECISLIADVDFPKRWDNLLPELVLKFNSPDPAVVEGVLMTANSIFKPFRYVQKSDALFGDILYALGHIQQPLLMLFKSISQSLSGFANDINQLKPRMESLRLICRIFYSLNWQDLPEYFEDHMGEWMEAFSNFLKYDNPTLTDKDEEDEPSPIDKLQVAIIENLSLYSSKDEEPFIPFLPNFTTLVWNLLMNVTSMPKHDGLATTSMKFLSSLVAKLMHRDLFKDENTLMQIISKIVVPNLVIRESDEEKFEDDPEEYILRDMEGSETVSRRKCSQELLKAMCRQFEDQTTAICLDQISKMLAEFNKDPSTKWAAKDTAINLMLGISIRAETPFHGVSAVNDKVNVMEFFSSSVLPELQESDFSKRPMVKATAIGYVSTFRNQFEKAHRTALIPLLISHLSSDSVVIHSYAASAIERLLTTKLEVNGQKLPALQKEDLTPFLEPLFTGLFTIIDNPNQNENEYAMKCVMRTLSVVKEDIMPVTQIVIEKLTTALGRVAKNPRNPQYNHYMFESLAVLIRSVCAQNSAYTSPFETLLFPPFQTVLQMDVTEFIPYVFQVFAQLLEYGPGMSAAYTALFPPLLTPALWESKGNVPALTRLLQAYLKKGPKDIVSNNYLEGLLGIFQKLLSARYSENYAFDLLNSLAVHIPYESLLPYLKTITQILLNKLQRSKTPRYTRLVTQYFSIFVGKFGVKAYLDQLNAVQHGLGLIFLTQVWLPRISTDPPARLEAKTQVIGLTKLLCDASGLLEDPNGQQIWAKGLFCLFGIISSPNSKLVSSDSQKKNTEVEQIEVGGYDSTFSKLHFAACPALDPFADVKDPLKFVATSLHNLSTSKPGQVTPLVQSSLQNDVKLQASFAKLMGDAGLNIV